MEIGDPENNAYAYRQENRKGSIPCSVFLFLALLVSANILLAQKSNSGAPPATKGAAVSPELSRSVREYGAKGDGMSDDYAAIHAAVDALGSGGGTLHFPPGSYRIGRASGRLLFNGGLEIAGLHNITVDFAPGAQIYMDNINPSTGLGDQLHGILISRGATHIRLINPKVVWHWQDGKVKRSIGDCIRVFGGKDSSSSDVVDDVLIQGGHFEQCPGNGVQTLGATRVKIFGNTIESTGGDGINANAGNQITIQNNTITSSGDDAIGLIVYYDPQKLCLTNDCGWGFNSSDIKSWNLNDSAVTGNTARFCIGGIHTSGVYNVAVTGNTIENSRLVGLTDVSDKTGSIACGGVFACPLMASKGVTFTGNRVTGTRLGILVQSYNSTLSDSDDWIFHDVTFVNNTIQDTPANEDSIRVWTARGVHFKGHKVTATKNNSGIRLYEAADSTVIDMTLSGTGTGNAILIGSKTYTNFVNLVRTNSKGEPSP
jgi:hypothetical protein